MITQGFPLFATTEEPSAARVWVVVGWVPVGNTGTARPVVAPLSEPMRNAVIPQDGYTWELHATQAEAETAAAPRRTSPEWSEADCRDVLRDVADRLDIIGATAPARRIRELLDNPAEPLRDADLRERLYRLADRIEREHHFSPVGGRTAAAYVREELAK